MMNSQEYASETDLQQWESIDWKLMEEKIRTLQARIVKAQQAGKHRKVRSLQWILTRSHAAKLLAVKRVTSNSGKNTPGVDGVIWSTPISKMKAVRSLKRKGYRPSPLRRVYIPKANGKLRPLSIPSMKDRAMQALYLMALDPVAETLSDTNSYGFRSKRSCADAIEQCFMKLAKKDSPQWILDADIKGCFDNISHEWLDANIPMDKRMLRLWLKTKIIDGKSFFFPELGTPQGGIISPVLANLVLNGLEKVMDEVGCKQYDSRGWARSNKFRIHLVRYADDFIVTASDRALLQEKIVPAIEDFLRPRGLSLSQEKTRITHIDQGFDFLGQNLRKYKNKLLIKPSPKNIKAVMEKIRTIVMKSKGASQATLIRQLNPIIRGWANYHRHVVAKQIFNDLDNYVFELLWYWARRRHTRKAHTWVREKYFHTRGFDHWCFSCIEDGKPVRLLRARACPIKRHIKIRGLANPYDPNWYAYFKSRKESSVARSSKAKGDRTSI